MSQQPAIDFDIDPTITSGTRLSEILNTMNDALVTMRSGPSRPPSAAAGTMWLNTSNPTNIITYYDGTVDTNLFFVDTATNKITVATGLVVPDSLDYYQAGRNLVMNGSFEINRDFAYSGAHTVGVNAYTIERYYVANNFQSTEWLEGSGGGPTKTVKLATTAESPRLSIRQGIEAISDSKISLNGVVYTLSFEIYSIETCTPFFEGSWDNSVQLVTPELVVTKQFDEMANPGTFQKMEYTFTLDTSTTGDVFVIEIGADRIPDFPQNTDVLIRRVQLERGSYATDYEIKSNGDIIKDCSRFIQYIDTLGGNGYAIAAGQQVFYQTLKYDMRIAPIDIFLLAKDGCAGNLISGTNILDSTLSIDASETGITISPESVAAGYLTWQLNCGYIMLRSEYI